MTGCRLAATPTEPTEPTQLGLARRAAPRRHSTCCGEMGQRARREVSRRAMAPNSHRCRSPSICGCRASPFSSACWASRTRAPPSARPLSSPHHCSVYNTPNYPPFTTRLAYPLYCPLNHPRRCVTESGRLLGVLTCLDLVEDAKGMVRSPRGAAAQVGTVACLGISRGNSLESTSSSRRSSTESAASCDANKELL